MQKSQIVSILRILDKKERRELKKWLLSPIHNQREDTLALYEYLITGSHLEEEKFLPKERVFKRIFPNEEYSDPKIRQTIHFLQKSVEEYLAYASWETNDIRQRLDLALAYRQKGLQKPLQRVLQQLEKLQEKQPFREEHYFRNEYFIQQEHYMRMAQQIRTGKLNLQAVGNALDKTYIIEKLKLSCRMLFHKSLVKADYDLYLADELVAHIEKQNLLEEPAVAVYYYILKALTTTDEHDYFERLRAEIQEHYQLFPNMELREVYIMAINFCIARMNAGQEDYVREGFEWYRQGLDQEILVENGVISQWTYMNVVMNGLKLREFEWTDQFIDEYRVYLAPKYRDNFSNFSRLKYLFDTGDYDAAQDLLTRTDFDDILINLMAKSTLLKIYYEQDEIDSLEALLESFRVYLKRKEVIGYHKQIYSNLVKYARKLIRVNPYDKEEVQKLREEVETANPLTERQWLLERLESL